MVEKSGLYTKWVKSSHRRIQSVGELEQSKIGRDGKIKKTRKTAEEDIEDGLDIFILVLSVVFNFTRFECSFLFTRFECSFHFYSF